MSDVEKLQNDIRHIVTESFREHRTNSANFIQQTAKNIEICSSVIKKQSEEFGKVCVRLESIAVEMQAISCNLQSLQNRQGRLEDAMIKVADAMENQKEIHAEFVAERSRNKETALLAKQLEKTVNVLSSELQSRKAVTSALLKALILTPVVIGIVTAVKFV